MKIKKEFIPFIIVLGVICLNFPIVILFYFFNYNLIENVFIPMIVPCELIMFGLTIIYTELKNRKVERTNCKICEGIIIKSEFKLHDSNWLKTPIVSYVVDGKKI